MGLDITAYQRLTPETGVAMEDGQPVEYDKFWKPYINEDFADRAAGIEPEKVYSFADSFGFRAGSYGGYNQWRAELCRRALGKEPRAVWDAKKLTGPFIELIHFSDCEGVIGPIVSAKLARDFAEHEGRLLARPSIDAFDEEEQMWFAENYRQWQKAFAMAADGGAVDFH